MGLRRPASSDAPDSCAIDGRSRGRKLVATLLLGAALAGIPTATAILPAGAHTNARALKSDLLKGDLLLTPALKARRITRFLVSLGSDMLSRSVPEITGGREPSSSLFLARAEFPSTFEGFAPATAQVELDRSPDADPNEILRFGTMRIPRWLVETILRAADVTGVDPVYMMALADKESSFSVGIRARTSSAEGLFQFVSKTWLEMVRDYGARHGLVPEAAAISTIDGNPVVADERMREHILGLRREPYVAALMAGELVKRDGAKLEARLGRRLTPSEFYLAHFLGAESAGRFMEVMSDRPRKLATHLFPAAAHANRTLFYARRGRRMRGLTVAEVFGKVDRMIDTRLDRYSDVVTAFAPGGDKL